jgi:RNA recognition motif-containing protein
VSTNPAKELFHVQIGPVRRVEIAYTPQGASKGVATVTFSKKGDAKKAYDRYNGKLIDNTRRLKVHHTRPLPSVSGVVLFSVNF